MRKLLFIAVLCALTAVYSNAAQCSDADQKALEAFDHAWGAAGVGGDKAALANIYADDYVGLPGMLGKTKTIDDTMETFEHNKANPSADKVTYDHYLISCTPVSATITHRNTIWTANGEGGKEQTFYTRSVHFLEKRGGKWQVVSNAGGTLDDYSVLWYMEQDWNDANLSRNKAWMEKNFAPDYVSISSMTGKMANKREDIASSVTDKGTMDLTETSDVNVRINGTIASVTGIYRWKGKDEKGVAYDHKIRFMDTFVKRDGQWVIWGTVGSEIK